ncbi:hypothetical protein IL306_014285 [Fusarium sp. DS 682]|nr:hypothetical protein IL306_014285 [Fusarium sp. DS 682]
MLKGRMPKTGIKNIRLNPYVPAKVETLSPDLSFILRHFEFDFAHGTGVGVARLSPFRAKTSTATELGDAKSWIINSVGTAIETEYGWVAEYGDKERYQAGKYHDPLGKARIYQQIREDEEAGREEFQPTVVIISAGHTGLSMAARYKLGKSLCVIILAWPNIHQPSAIFAVSALVPCVFTRTATGQVLEELRRYHGPQCLSHSILDGETAVYDEKEGRWALTFTRGDGTKHTLHPRHLMSATGISGTLPNIPDVPGMKELIQNGGIVTHSSHHRTDPGWKGKRVIVVSAAKSGHDISFELTEYGVDVTMIQRSATHVMSVEKSVRQLWKSREMTGRREGQAIDLLDHANFLKHSYPVEYEVMPRGQKIAREIDAELLQSLRNVGYRLHDGYHGGGAYSMFPFDQGGFYWDTVCCKLIADENIKLVHSEIEHFTKKGVKYTDGSTQQADTVVFATGYMNPKSTIQAILGDEVARKCHERWEKGNAFFIGPEGDSILNYCPLPQKGLYAMFHQFAFCRFRSARLALRIKAEELGIDVTPYGNKPLGPPSTADGQQPRPEGVPL